MHLLWSNPETNHFDLRWFHTLPSSFHLLDHVEAAQYGVPSLGGKDGGASDAIDHDKTGLICDGNNLDDIYSSLNSMIENKKYIEFGKNAKEYVSKFQWDKTFEEYKKILN